MNKFLLVATLLLCSILKMNAQKLPAYYDDYLKAKSEEIAAASSNCLDGFVFWTDSHIGKGSCLTGALISKILVGVKNPKVIFGGDVVVNGGDIDSCWRNQQIMEDKLRQTARFYRARGNHDFTGKRASDNSPYTFSQELTGKMFRSSTTADGVVRNPRDTNSCYCYFDEPEKKIRYVIFDTSDKIKSEDEFGLKTGISKRQRSWILKNALLGAPKGTSIIAVAHITSQKTLTAILGALASHSALEMDEKTYDFSSRKDLNLLFCVGGHTHYDFQRYQEGVPYIICCSDAGYKDYAIDPLLKGEIVPRKSSVRERSFSYFSITEDLSKVSMIRFGCGFNSIYNLKPITLKNGKKTNLVSTFKNVDRWEIYDSQTSVFVKYSKLGIPSPNGLKGKIDLVSENASITSSGQIKALKAGESVAVAIAPSGEREFFFINITD